MKRRWIILLLTVAWLPWLGAAWFNTLPSDSGTWNIAAGYIRNNWDAIEVVLGVDLSMEGSAYPWYQSSAPTTKADGSTALDATDNGFLWIDSDTRKLYTYIHGTGFTALEGDAALVTFVNGDMTPTVAIGSTFLTYAGTLTISDFDNGIAGKVITVQSKGTVTFDVESGQDAAHNLDGSSANIVTASGDVTVWECENGTTWNLVRFNDASADNSDADVGEKATTVYVDAQDLATALQESGATVFNTTLDAASTFQDLDLSAYVGSTYAVVWLEVVAPFASAAAYIVRTNAYGSGTFTDHYSQWHIITNEYGPVGGTVIVGDGADCYGYICLITDSVGRIEHGCTSNAATITIKLIGFIAQ